MSRTLVVRWLRRQESSGLIPTHLRSFANQIKNRREPMKVYGRSKTLCYFVLPALLLAACVLQPTSATAQMTKAGIDCSQITSLKLLMQDNMRAGQALVECGVVQGGRPSAGDGVAALPPNILVSNRACSNSSNCTKSENMVWGNGSTIVVNY